MNLNTFKLSAIILMISATTTVHGQIEKKNWLVGGNARGSYQETSTSSLQINQRNLNGVLQVGFFPIKKLAFGVLGHYSHLYTDRNARGSWWDRSSASSGTETQNTWSVGPFARYYFLPMQNRFNFYLQGSVERGEMIQGIPASQFFNSRTILTNLRAGQVAIAPVYFINKKVSVEMIVAYTRLVSINNQYAETDNITMGVGLQVHLGKPKSE
jgi:hypothetical protein